MNTLDLAKESADKGKEYFEKGYYRNAVNMYEDAERYVMDQAKGYRALAALAESMIYEGSPK